MTAHRLAPPGAGSAAGRYLGRLALTLALTTLVLALEVVGGLWTGSLALLADAGHMLADVGGLTLSLVAAWFARRPPTPSNTYGYVRMEVLAALANGIALLLVAGWLLYEAARRLRAPVDVHAGPMLAVALVGLAANLAGMRLLRHGARESLNVRGAYLELLSDALGSAGVVAAAVVVGATGLTWVDPLVSVVIGALILPRTARLLRQTVHVLMEGVPPHLDLREIEGAMRESHGILAVHDLHVWTLTSGREALSAHVLVADLADGQHVLGDLRRLLRDRFGIDHVTVQLESDLSPLVQIRDRPATPAGPRDPAEPAPRVACGAAASGSGAGADEPRPGAGPASPAR